MTTLPSNEQYEFKSGNYRVRFREYNPLTAGIIGDELGGTIVPASFDNVSIAAVAPPASVGLRRAPTDGIRHSLISHVRSLANRALEPWSPGALQPWSPGALEPWSPGPLDPGSPGAPEPWIPGSLGLWSPGALEPRCPEDSGIALETP